VRACIEYRNLNLAVELVEQGLATALQKTMRLKTKPRERLAPSVAEQLDILSSEIYDANRSSAARQEAAGQRECLIACIRKKEDFKHFLMPKPYSELRQASRNGPVVILNSHKKGCDAIILLGPEDPLRRVALPDSLYTELEQNRKMLQNLLGGRSTALPEDTSQEPRSDEERINILRGHTDCAQFPHLLRWVEEKIINPIYKILKEVGVL
jgi:hypothetical protein